MNNIREKRLKHPIYGKHGGMKMLAGKANIGRETLRRIENQDYTLWVGREPAELIVVLNQVLDQGHEQPDLPGSYILDSPGDDPAQWMKTIYDALRERAPTFEGWLVTHSGGKTVLHPVVQMGLLYKIRNIDGYLRAEATHSAPKILKTAAYCQEYMQYNHILKTGDVKPISTFMKNDVATARKFLYHNNLWQYSTKLKKTDVFRFASEGLTMEITETGVCIEEHGRTWIVPHFVEPEPELDLVLVLGGIAERYASCEKEFVGFLNAKVKGRPVIRLNGELYSVVLRPNDFSLRKLADSSGKYITGSDKKSEFDNLLNGKQQ